ncbi:MULTISPECIES: helix-turn-helix domain-containing protein [Thermoactinomyces]|jgi:DNA-binding HxlR family transcriptional regulator|uniref:Helix-turn-helix transcriptional regulator n=1 Tax=Thermoactinomyces daqus TaxID=1329516 RepID=A0A7W2AIX1_9BACL|nr:MULTISPECIES: helix-turn-helix domain-containing protein [Thermoactinomyces]MBA4543705.1 helix-turn-helix transcriptional regulator [Thermoactinomyces daqus]MBH8597486.1 helix-turn-helix transcriptional regulator [Thermoactinomyces sp. CICC 10523]MBH8603827.1 helix-turn-helix transcriptional regulator [Thermoactinomyces sp. CICC 10522]MBH8608564.1 helix-turn-helix transcriptional regulator [Thermoactinomyces sp. CICC 10521]
MERCICPKFEAAIEILSKKWTGLIIRVLMEKTRRFRDIREQIPLMSERMLAERLKELEAHGIVERRVYPETPVRIEYDLTEKGKALAPVLDSIQDWAEQWIGAELHESMTRRET